MGKDGLAETSTGTIPAPKGMYEEIETIEDVARGHVIVKELIVYDVVGVRKDEDGKIIIKDGKEVPLEKGRRPFFCQTNEQELVFKENNPNARIESFTIQLLKSTAIKKLNDPSNMKQFKKEGK